ncbi:glycosyltransferase [Lutibacter sp. A80]|uniref:glycosyltransferase n=1 Tax=Lutibacter sp. A80 TaxID=2918453 RepID=UPI001F054329|nr:glycosyltransferase [Lutibacter sp. A80]UMB61996.1 glycosyltransferase [Lutibacter sp. A80]
MKRIIVSVTNDLTTDQRVAKVCNTLTKMGFSVLLIGRKLKNSENINRQYDTFRFKLIFNKGFLFYAEYNLRLFFKLFFLKKDILLSNDLDTLLPNFLTSKIFKIKLVYDSHELFTEVPELINRPFIQKCWLTIEKNILPNIKNCYTVSDSIKNYYNLKYKTDFITIRNLPITINSTLKKELPFNIKNKKIILYQGAINKARGLELMITTMQFIENTIFVIIGSGDIEKDLIKQLKVLNLEEKVKLIPKQSPKELQKITPLADLGISIEEDFGLNYKFALPNKIFDYIHAKVPVLVSDLPEMKNIIQKHNVGEVIKDRNPKKLANQITTILQKDKAFYNSNLENAKKTLNWENESEHLKKIFSNLK